MRAAGVPPRAVRALPRPVRVPPRPVRALPGVMALALSAIAVLGAATAQARTTRLPAFELRPGPGFAIPSSVAIDQETGNIFVTDAAAGTVYIFGREGGAPAGGAPAAITGLSFTPEYTTPPGVAVDDACYFHVPRLSSESKECKELDPSNGDVYVADTGAQLLEKLQLNTLTHEYEVLQSIPFNSPRGVAVDTQGDVYVADPSKAAITELTPKAGEVQITQSAIEKPVYVAVGAPGTVYVGGKGQEGGFSGQGVAKLAVNAGNEGAPQPLGGQSVVRGGPIALDANGNAFVDVESHIDEYDTSGNQTGSFQFDFEKQLAGGGGLAVDDETGDVAIANLVYGVPVAQPEPSIAPASAIGKATAMLNGTIVPEEEEAEYHFEYGPCPSGASSCEAAGYPFTTSGEKIGPAGVGAALAVHATVAALKPQAYYHFRLVTAAVKDGAPGLTSAEEIFETASAVHGIGQCATSAISARGAELTAPLEPLVGELPVEYHFEYGLSAPPTPAEPYEHRTATGEIKKAAQIGSVTAMLPGLGEAPLQPHTTYHCRLVAAAEGVEALGEDNSFTTSPVPPRVEAASAAPGAMPRTSVLLAGQVDPEHSHTTYHFSYIDEAELIAGDARTVTWEANAGESLAPTAVGPVRVAGLHAGTTYHYQLVATNSFGEHEASDDQTFTTAPATPPSVGATAASGITQTAATVAGELNPRALPTTYELQLATTVLCPMGRTACTGVQATYDGAHFFGTLPPGRDEVVVELENLAPATTYHYRLVATNEDGTEYGNDATFTTLGVLAPIVQPATPPLIAAPAIAFPLEGAPQTSARKGGGKLEHALTACRKKHSKHKRAMCEKRARKQYGAAKKKG